MGNVDRKLQSAEKQKLAMELRLKGLTYEEIAKQVGYKNRKGAHNAVKRNLEHYLKEPTEELRATEVARLDAALDAIWTRCLNGHLASIGVALRIMERRATLLGLDAPKEFSTLGEPVNFIITRREDKQAPPSGLDETAPDPIEQELEDDANSED